MTVHARFSSGLLQRIWHFSELPQTPVSLRQMCQFGPQPDPGVLFKASCFLVGELQVRLARRIKELGAFPYGLNKMEDIIQIRDWYVQSFKDLHDFSHDLKTRNGRLYQMLYGDMQPEMLEEKELLRNVVQLLYNESELKSPKEGQMALPKKARKYYSTLPSHIGYKNDMDEDQFYKFWPKDVLMFNQDYFKVLNKIKRRHDATVITMAKGLFKWKRTLQQNVIDASVQDYLDRFYMSRIGIRMLIGQHLALLQQGKQQQHSTSAEDHELDKDYVGIICTKTSITELANDAIDRARYICAEHYGLYEAPKVELLSFPLRKSTTKGNQPKELSQDIEFMYVPGHLMHMLFETLKNALRATVEKILQENPDTKDKDSLVYPVVKVVISEGLEDLTVKISDEGGGIARSNLPLVWTYLYTTMPTDEQARLIEEDSLTYNCRAPIAGFGYGLALSRLYSRYFGGDLKLISMEGFGTDVYLHLNRLSTSSEPLQ
ncbi:PDK/BCKDK family protein kinase Ecym_2505 [Eremothecium cymbalariae DBVPG|uniref:Protein-serine/threonine kinase n=1 Tax=Eremothecium cymbalariae (strain CBS 270.75 / DBVPG 7215 / KCTC 17166 / NRRL Y-17582) TaxID=931890 RepID=G8JPW8_ERECY|nr:Hypothetical protein Ecym_2505 [Eremothecium cymbalariae DBVPG\